MDNVVLEVDGVVNKGVVHEGIGGFGRTARDGWILSDSDDVYLLVEILLNGFMQTAEMTCAQSISKRARLVTQSRLASCDGVPISTLLSLSCTRLRLGIALGSLITLAWDHSKVATDSSSAVLSWDSPKARSMLVSRATSRVWG